MSTAIQINRDLLAACKALVAAYAAGEESSHVDWNDVDGAYALAVRAIAAVELPETIAAAAERDINLVEAVEIVRKEICVPADEWAGAYFTGMEPPAAVQWQLGTNFDRRLLLHGYVEFRKLCADAPNR